MSLEAAWGFDPDKAKAKALDPSKIETDETAYSAEEQRNARIPCGVHAQIYELRRMYRI